jgi:hypothetical protein
MISVVQQPPLVSLSDNPVVFNLATNNLYVNTGVVAICDITITTSHTHGQSFTLSYLEHDLTFTCSSSPNTSGLQYPTKPAGQSLYEWVEILASYLSQNYILSSDFLITAASNVVRFTAKEKGVDYELSISGAPTGTTISTFQTGVDVDPRPNFKLLVQLFKSNATDQLLGEELQDPNDDLQCWFDEAEYLRSELMSDFTFPEGASKLIDHPESVVKYYIRHAEMYGSPPVVKALVTEDSLYAICGGIDWVRLSRYNLQSTSWYDRFCYNHMFLSWQPLTKVVDVDQVEKLYFLNKSETAITLKLKAKLYWGAVTLGWQEVGSLDCNGVGIVECLVGHDNLSDPDPDSLTKYEIRVEDSAGLVLSETRTFTIDHNVYPYKKYLIFQNSLGGWDTVRFLGKTSIEGEYARLISSTINDYSFTNQEGSIVQGRPLESLKMILNTGWISQNNKDYLRELLVSQQVYEISGSMILPVVVTSSNVFMSKDDETLYNMEIEVLYAFTDSHRSTSLVLPTNPVLSGSYNRSYNHSFDVNY